MFLLRENPCLFKMAARGSRNLQNLRDIPERKSVLQMCLGLPFFMRAALGLGIYWLLA